MLAFSPSTSDEEKIKIRILYDELEKVCEEIQNIISPFLKKTLILKTFLRLNMKGYLEQL